MISKRNILLTTFGLIAFGISSYAVWSIWNGNNLTIQEMRIEIRKEKERFRTFNGITRLSIARMNEVKVDIAYGLGMNKEAAVKRVNLLNDKIPEDYPSCPSKPDVLMVMNYINEKLNYYENLYITNARNLTILLDHYGDDVKSVEEHFESTAGDCKPNIFYFTCILQLNELFNEEIESLVSWRDNISETIHNLNNLLKAALETSLQANFGILENISEKINAYICCVKNLKVHIDTHDLECVEPNLY